MKRRELLKCGAVLGTVGGVGSLGYTNRLSITQIESRLDDAARRPVLKTEFFSSPVIIKKIDLLKHGENFILRAESSDGAIGYAVSNNARMRYLYPLLLQCVVPFFIGKDARHLDSLIDGVYTSRSNYKLQGLAFWVCVASVEMVLLDLLGQVSGKSVGNLLGEVQRTHSEIYRASGNRGNTPEEEMRILFKLVDETGAKAIKFKVGGRMSNNHDSLPGRSEALVPMVRRELGDEMILYADSNGSYDAAHGITLGRLMEENAYGYFEEPCPFDHLEETKRVADALTIPIAGGEQESSHRRFRWMIANQVVQIVQPDLFYYGGFIRAIRVGRMAEVMGMQIVPHMSGTTLGYLYVVHFASFMPNSGRFMEYKGRNDAFPVECPTSSLDCVDGKIQVPSGAGFGLVFDSELIKESKVITL